MKKNMIYAIVIVVVIVLCFSVILMINNKNLSIKQEEANQSNGGVVSKNEVNKMSDDQLIDKTVSGEESLSLDNVENDTIGANIDSVLNEKDPLLDMPGQ